jgi:hypothetical protein
VTSKVPSSDEAPLPPPLSQPDRTRPRQAIHSAANRERVRTREREFIIVGRHCEKRNAAERAAPVPGGRLDHHAFVILALLPSNFVTEPSDPLTFASNDLTDV